MNKQINKITDIMEMIFIIWMVLLILIGVSLTLTENYFSSVILIILLVINIIFYSFTFKYKIII